MQPWLIHGSIHHHIWLYPELFIYFYFMWMNALLASWCSLKWEELEVRSPGTGIRMVVSLRVVMGMEPQFSARATALNSGAICPAPLHRLAQLKNTFSPSTREAEASRSYEFKSSLVNIASFMSSKATSWDPVSKAKQKQTQNSNLRKLSGGPARWLIRALCGPTWVVSETHRVSTELTPPPPSYLLLSPHPYK